MDRLRAMQTFVAIAEHGSLSAAARAEGQSLPATVRMLAALEQQLGVRLVNRTTRRLALTDEGALYLERCRNILAEVALADAAVAPPDHTLAGTLRVSAPVLFGQQYLAPALRRYAGLHPAVRCSVQLDDRVVDLIEQRIDVAVRVGTLADSSLVAQQVGQLQRVVVASPAYLERHGTPAHPQALAQANCIRFPIGTVGRWAFKSADGERYDVAVRGNLEFNHSAAAVDACRAGMGIGLFGAAQVADDIAAGRLRPLLLDHAADPVPVNLVYPRAQLLPQRTRAFIDAMKAELRPALRRAHIGAHA